MFGYNKVGGRPLPMVLLKPGRHGLFVRNVHYCDILYEAYMFCSVFYVSELLDHKEYGEEGNGR